MRDKAPIKNTCPDIDRVLSAIKSIQQLCKLSGMESKEDLQELISSIESEAWGQDGALEDLRSANETLREWGNEQHERADDAEGEIEDLKREMISLEDLLNESERQLKILS